MRVEGTTMRTSNSLDLKNPYFRYTGQPAQPPPGTSHVSPSEVYWNQLDVQGARQGEFNSLIFFSHAEMIGFRDFLPHS